MKNTLYLLILLLVGCGTSEVYVKQSKGFDIPKEPINTPVYKGAIGFGKNALGGYGGTTYKVEKCSELLDVINKNEPRTILWKKSLNCGQPLEINKPYLTIVAENGSYEGNGVVITTHDVIIKGLTVAVGDNGYSVDGINHADEDAILIASGAKDIILDDVLTMWSIDENIGFYGNVSNVTIMNSRIVEALNASHHKDGSHSMGLLINENSHNISILNNVFMHNIERNIRQGIGCSSEVRGNIFFGMRRTSEISNGGKFTFEDNLYLKGRKQEVLSSALVNDVGSGVRVYSKGNTSDYGARELESSIIDLNAPEIHSGDKVISGYNLLGVIKYRVDKNDYNNKLKLIFDEALLNRKGQIIDTQIKSLINN